jgi:hypothetical protein
MCYLYEKPWLDCGINVVIICSIASSKVVRSRGSCIVCCGRKSSSIGGRKSSSPLVVRHWIKTCNCNFKTMIFVAFLSIFYKLHENHKLEHCCLTRHPFADHYKKWIIPLQLSPIETVPECRQQDYEASFVSAQKPRTQRNAILQR